MHQHVYHTDAAKDFQFFKTAKLLIGSSCPQCHKESSWKKNMLVCLKALHATGQVTLDIPLIIVMVSPNPFNVCKIHYENGLMTLPEETSILT